MNIPVSKAISDLLNQKGYNWIQGFLQDEIADVVMWIYEKHGIWINVCPIIIEYNYTKDCINFTYLITKLKTYLENGKMYGNDDKGIFSNSYYYDSPTEAYEAAIEYTLNNFINGV